VAHVLVVGAGLAGARTCAEVRRSGYSGRLTLVGAEGAAPYDRPPLTKDPEVEVDLRAAMDLDVWQLAEEVRLGLPARDLWRGADGLVVAVGGDTIDADAVVVATGATPIVPDGWAGPGVHLLHTRGDAARFWGQIGPGVRLEVVGGGWIGSEAAATAAARGSRVTLHEQADHLLPGRVPEQVAARVSGWLEEAGVSVQLGARVAGVLPDPGAPSIQTADGRAVADLVLVGLGVRPETQWLARSGVALADSGAVPVDPWGRCAVPGLFAVGDVATRWSARAGRHLPGGHWTEALNAPTDLATGLLAWVQAGCDPAGWATAPADVAPDPVPYVFSDIAARTLQVLGDASWDPARGDALVWRESAGGWSAFRLDAAGRLRGVASSGRPRDVAMARRLIMASADVGPVVDPVGLADPAASVKRVVGPVATVRVVG
jgi:3-phenylpropionate/trans-cinnamate dioxygenase ferredoxin reductase subunit